MLDTAQLVMMLTGNPITKPYFHGVYPADELSGVRWAPLKIEKYPALLIANTDESDMPGQHWVGFFFTEDKTCEFFDSYGNQPWKYYYPWLKFMYVNSDMEMFNDKCVQAPTSTTCGHHCLFFLNERCKGLSMKKIVDMYSDNLKYNDLFVMEYTRNILYEKCKISCECIQSCKPLCS